MKLVSFRHDSRDSFGVVVGDGIVDVGARAKGRYRNLIDAIGEPGAFDPYQAAAADFSLGEVTLLPPIPNSGRIICVGLNYKTHIAETGRDVPKYPLLFPRYHDSLVGHDAALVRPAASEKFDFEGELAFVIGKPGRAISPENARDHVAGYSCLNDGSIRDYQRHTTQFLPGKNFPATGSFGPWLVTPDEFGDVARRRLQTRLNGEVVQSTGLDDLLFGVETLVAYLSIVWCLQPGDVVATGTTGGVGAYREPPLWMAPGDKIEVEITGIGVLSNTIIQES